MKVEQLLTEALHGTEEYLPSPDLFAKVRRSIEEDAAHRLRVRRALRTAGAALATAIVWVAAFLDIADGTATMPWWSVEILTAAILISMVMVLGPLIRRFGRVLALEVFRRDRGASERFLALLDIAYYLVFSAVILIGSSFSADPEWGERLATQLESELNRIAGMAFVMGVLHAITIAILPVMGLILASSWRRAARQAMGKAAPAPDPKATRADRVATIIVWLVAAGIIAQVLLAVVPILLGGAFGGD